MDPRVWQEIRNAVLDLQASEAQTFERSFLRLSRALNALELKSINESLKTGVDLDAVMQESERTGGSMVGSHTFKWPGDPEKDLGVALQLVDRLAADRGFAINFCHTYFYSGSKIIAGIRTFVRQVLIPFERDYRAFVESKLNFAASAEKNDAKPRAEWSARRAWVMGIVGTLVTSGFTAGAVWVFSKPDLPKEERAAVFSLIQDMRDTLIYMTVFYQQKHNFIDEHWGKADPKDTFYTTREMQVTLFDLAHRLGRHHDALEFLSPAHGQVAGTVKGIDRTIIDGKVDYRVTFQVSDLPPQSAELDFSHLRVLTSTPTLLSDRLVAHVNNLDLPGGMRAALQNLAGRSGGVVSFKRVTESSIDFVLASAQSLAVTSAPKFAPDSALYVHEGSVQELLSAAMELTDALDSWADRYGIDLGTVSRRAFDQMYEAKPGGLRTAASSRLDLSGAGKREVRTPHHLRTTAPLKEGAISR